MKSERMGVKSRSIAKLVGMVVVGLFTFGQCSHSIGSYYAGDDHSLSTVAISAAVLSPLVILGLLSSSGSSGNSGPAPAPTPDPGPGPGPGPTPTDQVIPTIMSSSQYNLICAHGTAGQKSAAVSKIVVKNSGSEEATTGFDLEYDATLLEVLDSSSCKTGPVAAGGQCEFEVKYRGAASAPLQVVEQPLKLTVSHGGNNAVVFTVKLIDIPSGLIFDPTEYDSKAAGIVATAAINDLLGVNHLDQAIILAATSKGIYKTTNDGASWMKIVSDQNEVKTLLATGNVYALSSSAGKVYAAVFDSGQITILVSADFGNSWSKLIQSGTGLTINNPAPLLVAAGKLYAGHEQGVLSVGLDDLEAGLVELGSLNQRVYALHLNNGQLYAGTGSGVYRLDSGAWVSINGFTAPSYSLVTSTQTASVLYVGSASGKIYQLDLANFTKTEINTGLPTANISSILAVQNGEAEDLYFGTWGSHIYRWRSGARSSYDTGINWLTTTGHSSGATRLRLVQSAAGSKLLLSGFTAGGIYTDPIGETAAWSMVNHTIFSDKIKVVYLSDSKIYVGTDDAGVFVSEDHGANWRQLTTFNLGTPPITALTLKDGYLYAGVLNTGTNQDTIYRLDLSNLAEGWSLTVNGLGSIGGSSCSTNHPCRLETRSLALFQGDLYAGIYNKLMFSSTGNMFGGVYRLNTANNKWEYSPLYNDAGTMVSCHTFSLFAESSYLYASNYLHIAPQNGIEGLYRTSNGSSWSQQPQSGYPPANSLIFSILDENTTGKLYVGSDATLVYAGRDKSLIAHPYDSWSWALDQDGIYNSTIPKTAHALCHHAGALYAGITAGSGSVGGGVYKKGATSWGRVASAESLGVYALQSFNESLLIGSNHGFLKMLQIN